MSMLQTGPLSGEIPPEIKRELQRELDLLLAQEPVPITTDLEERTVLLRLLDDARIGGATPVDGQIQRFRPGQPVDYENEGVLEQTTSKRSMSPRLTLILMAVAVLAIFGIVALTTVFAAPKAGKSSAATPSVLAAASAVAEPTLTQEPLGAVRVGNAGLPAVYPNALGIVARQWTVNVAPVEKGAWKVAQETNTANWLAGSVVNWSFALWNDAAGSNAAVFGSLGAGTTATLYLSSGAVRSFRLGAVQHVARPAITILGQQTPGLTIVLIGGDPSGERAVVRGVEQDGIAEGTPTQTGAASQP